MLSGAERASTGSSRLIFMYMCFCSIVKRKGRLIHHRASHELRSLLCPEATRPHADLITLR